MMHQLAIVSSALMALVSGAPSSLDTRQISVNPTIQNFESALPILTIEPIGTRGAINYVGMAYGRTGGLQNAAVTPPNSDTVVATSGALNLITILQGGQASMEAATGYSSFTLYSFYYGCAVNSEEVAVGVPASCTITATAYSDAAGTNVIGTQNFVFTASTLGSVVISTPMVKATVPNTFANAVRVDFSTATLLNGLPLAILLDTIAYSFRQ